MEKIDITEGVNAGDSGPIGGGKINNNFNEVAKILFGEDIWQGVVTQDISELLQGLPTNNKTSFLAAFIETNSKINTVQPTSIIASGGIFKWSKKPSNTTDTIVAGEVITNGRISETVHVYSAIYESGDINDFGTEANNFTDGSYTEVQYQPNL